MHREQVPFPQEIELKLSVAPTHATRVWKTAAVCGGGKVEPAARRLYSAYYDTSDFAFRQHGAAVRLRRESGRWVQTVKVGASATGGLHTRRELEIPIPAPLINYPSLVEAGLGETLANASRRRAVGVVFTTTFRRSRAVIEPSPGDHIEIAVDRGEIVAGERRVPICEIELELKSGAAQALFRLARELAAEIPLRLENESKAERGYRLAAGETHRPVKAVAPELRRDMDVDSAFAEVVSSGLRQLQANEHGLLEAGDPEYLHQARVALRRLRCAFGAFSRAVPKTFFRTQLVALRQLGQTLGGARDLDVFLTQTLVAAGRGERADELALLRRRAFASGRKARKAARSLIRAPAYTGLILELAEALSSTAWGAARDEEQMRCARLPLPEFCAGVLSRRDRKARKRGNSMDRSDPGALHPLRIELKKLRYACEFFAPLYSRKKSRDYLKRLTALQEILGSINDCAVASQLLRTLTSRRATAAGCLRGYLAAQTALQLEAFAQAWP
ncbi:MAG: CHAD domain-containing protein, partial [Burkholderiales bacterium]